jgi:hypothetical protein
MTEACTILVRPIGEDALGVVFETKENRIKVNWKR